MLLNLKKCMKNGEIKSEKKIKKYIKKCIKNDEVGEMDFVNTFVKIANKKRWKWYKNEINKETVIQHLINDTYRIVKSEIDYYLKF